MANIVLCLDHSFAVFCRSHAHMSQILHLIGVCHLFGGLNVLDNSMGVNRCESSAGPSIVAKHRKEN